MAQLYPAQKHCELRNIPWSEDQVRRGIHDIVDDAVAHFDETMLWPTHPLDGDQPYGTSCYLGASGVLCGLSSLQRLGFVQHELPTLPHELLKKSRQLNETFPADLNAQRSYLFGDLPLSMLALLHGGGGEGPDSLFARLETGLEAEVLELMWGLSGEMLVALHLYDLLKEPRWRDLYCRQAARLVAAAEQVPQVGLQWKCKLYGRAHEGLGAVHGFAGNAVALLRGVNHLEPSLQRQILDGITGTLVTTAVQDEEFANWPRSTGKPDWHPDDMPYRLYHCHGAPGIISSVSTLPVGHSTELDEILLKAGQLIYAAGPLRKGPSLCHGTAGNGLALLKLYERTEGEIWLARAREFAMHALWQVEQSRPLFNQGRYSLWTGDVGVACFLAECLSETARFPTIDVF